MRYLGGKSRIARKIAAVINEERGTSPLWDPFCGGLSSAVALGGELLCSDVHPGLISLYQAVQRAPGCLDWIPELTTDDYEFAKTLPQSDPVATFIGFGLSFRGQWFRGLAGPRQVRPNGPTYSMLESSRRRVVTDVAAIPGATFACLDWMTLAPQGPRFLYLDPPYRGTQGYEGVPPFDHEAFVKKVAQWALWGATLWVSEYEFPLGRIVWETPRKRSGVSRAGAQPFERLYRIGPV